MPYPELTRQELEYALDRIGHARISTIAKNLGRPAGCVRRSLGNVQKLVIRDEGLGIAELVREFGVNDKTVMNWIRRGALKAITKIVEKQRIHVFSNDDVTTFLRDYGYALSPIIKPQSHIWRDIVSEIRAELESWLIAGAGVQSALLYPKMNFGYMRRNLGFPEPHFRLGNRAGGDWYRREDIAAWLRANPRYITHAAAEEFDIPEGGTR
jgi:hypothetical protein